MKKKSKLSKKKKYCVKLKDLWCNKFKFTQKGGGFASCIMCRSDFSVEHGGENNSNIHKDTSKHKRYVDAVQQQRKLTNFGASSATEQAFFWFSG